MPVVVSDATPWKEAIGLAPDRLRRWQERHERRAAEPRLDVRQVVDAAAAGPAEQLPEGLVELGRERRLVGEAREMGEQVAELLELVAGQLRPDLDDEDGVGRDVRQRRRGGLAAEHHDRGDDARDGQSRDAKPDRPSERGSPGCRAERGRHATQGRRGDRRRCRRAARRPGPASAARRLAADRSGASDRLSCPPHRFPNGMPPSMPRPRPPASCFIRRCISENCLTSRLTSVSEVPEPAAMRRRRDPLRTVGSRRSWRRHRADDRLGPPEVAAVDRILGFLGHAAHARDHAHELADRAHLLDLLELVEEVLEGELGLAELLLELGGLASRRRSPAPARPGS